ncbi:MAG TPA: UDP-N-acetylmuramoyl-L-alanyl-D-glutamate--2,6-diaminopimelate ligase [Tepidisphaeraceae bacterium]|jgi:UDP-N-acetylmuramoyl-L-alanyl-D-glutamate--2,6-diaminopimelate ligase|nr:UDP-N-acetylmuramoyl-L-alanyl-D-glutamate--2,6-diaminopimelate ligase [Tepidisphaeraceae bacterium]
MRLHQLVLELDPRFNLLGIADVPIAGVCEDSRRVAVGDLFIARTGRTTEGAIFIAQAVERGAAAVVTAMPSADCAVPQVILPNPAAVSAALAHLFYGNPSKSIRAVGVTGTNGKTTTTYLLRHILNKTNYRCGLIGTVETDDGRDRREATMTTPGAIDLAKLLASIRDNGCRACAMETSSHALDQGRVDGVRFAGAAFTNLTRDHLDYHGQMENYAAAKAKLFAMLDEDAIAVINAEDSWSERMVIECKARIVRFGFGQQADYCARDIAMTSQGSRFILHTPDGSTEVALGMIGRHNIANALTAAALLGEVFRLSVHQIAAGLQDAQGAPGRLQLVRCPGAPGFAVLVDYAHTDDALEKVLTALRPLTRGKLRVMFGCGGDRDRTKRPLMARTAERLADIVYVTSDNPRTENPGDIIEQILTGFPRTGSKTVIVEPDRRVAITKVLEDARSGDVVLLAGKGHENYQIVGQTRHHFDDVEEAAKVLRKMSPSKSS